MKCVAYGFIYNYKFIHHNQFWRDRFSNNLSNNQSDKKKLQLRQVINDYHSTAVSIKKIPKQNILQLKDNKKKYITYTCVSVQKLSEKFILLKIWWSQLLSLRDSYKLHHWLWDGITVVRSTQKMKKKQNKSWKQYSLPCTAKNSQKHRSVFWIVKFQVFNFINWVN